LAFPSFLLTLFLLFFFWKPFPLILRFFPFFLGGPLPAQEMSELCSWFGQFSLLLFSWTFSCKRFFFRGCDAPPLPRHFGAATFLRCFSPLLIAPLFFFFTSAPVCFFSSRILSHSRQGHWFFSSASPLPFLFFSFFGFSLP